MTPQNKKRAAEGTIVVGAIVAVWYFWPHIKLFLGNVFGNHFGLPGANQTQNDTDTQGKQTALNPGAADNTRSSKGTTSTTSNMNETDEHGAPPGTLIYPDDCEITTKDGSRPCTDQEWQDAASPAAPATPIKGYTDMTTFMSDYKGLINQLSQQYQIQPGIILAIAGIESTQQDANGNWVFGTHENAVNANNFFNIKADANWRGDTYQDSNGNSWRAYATPADSIKDVYAFLKNNSRYTDAGLFNSTSIIDQANALQKAGYAGDNNNYAASLIPMATKSKLLFDNVPDNYNSAGLDWFPVFVTIGIGVALLGGVELVGAKGSKKR